MTDVKHNQRRCQVVVMHDMLLVKIESSIFKTQYISDCTLAAN